MTYLPALQEVAPPPPWDKRTGGPGYWMETVVPWPGYSPTGYVRYRLAVYHERRRGDYWGISTGAVRIVERAEPIPAGLPELSAPYAEREAARVAKERQERQQGYLWTAAVLAGVVLVFMVVSALVSGHSPVPVPGLRCYEGRPTGFAGHPGYSADHDADKDGVSCE